MLITFAVREGVEPPCCDSMFDTVSALCGQPISNTYLVISAPETRGCVCRVRGTFHHLTFCGGSGIRTPVTVSRNSVFKTDAFDRSAKPPFFYYNKNSIFAV